MQTILESSLVGSTRLVKAALMNLGYGYGASARRTLRIRRIGQR